MTRYVRTALQNYFRKPLPSAGELEVPDSGLLRSCGFDAQTLRLRGVVVQRSRIAPAGFALVVAQAQSVSIGEFEQVGVQVLRADARDIERIWQAWDREQVMNQDALGISRDVTRVLHQIVADCAELGAEEVFLGHPSDCSYEGIVQGKRFSGFVHQRVFVECLSAIRRLGELTLPTNPPSRAALTRNFERPIVCLTWTLPQSENPERESPTLRDPTPPAPPAETSAAAGEQLPGEPPRLLLVDDDERFGAVLTQILQARGYHVMRASNGEQALALFEAAIDVPHLMISDVHMPIVDGRSLVATLRDRRLPVPVIMLTSDDNQLLEADLVMLGANAYIRKREDPRVLLAWVQNLLHPRENT